jgi:hypothetical protein
LHPGAQLVGAKLPLPGSPLTLNVTGCDVPDTNVVEMEFVTDCPATTDRSPPVLSEKSNPVAAATVDA